MYLEEITKGTLGKGARPRQKRPSPIVEIPRVLGRGGASHGLSGPSLSPEGPRRPSTRRERYSQAEVPARSCSATSSLCLSVCLSICVLLCIPLSLFVLSPKFLRLVLLERRIASTVMRLARPSTTTFPRISSCADRFSLGYRDRSCSVLFFAFSSQCVTVSCSFVVRRV